MNIFSTIKPIISSRVLSEKLRKLSCFQQSEIQKLMALDWHEDFERINTLKCQSEENDRLANELWELKCSWVYTGEKEPQK